LTQAQLSPVEPIKVALGPPQEMIWSGKRAVERSRSWLDMLPVPISTAGLITSPYLTSANWITRDQKKKKCMENRRPSGAGQRGDYQRRVHSH